MNWDQSKCNWKQVSDKIKLTWGKMSEEKNPSEFVATA